MPLYRVKISDQTDDEGNEETYVQSASSLPACLLRVYERYHDMVQAKKITIVEEQA